LVFPGTITLSAATLLTLIQEIVASLYRSGFRKLVLMNSHGGQPQVMEIAARDIHQQYPDFLVFPFSLGEFSTMGLNYSRNMN
jgi:creatinine amidohydrolase